MAVTKTGSTAVKISKPYGLYVTPYVSGDVGTTTYFIEDVIRDTTSLIPDDNTVNDIESEFYDEPIHSNIILGMCQFASTIGDVQPDLLENLLNFKKDSVSGKIYAPASYKDVYAKIDIVLQNGEGYSAYVCPKVKLNGKTTIESLSSNMAQIPLAGTAYSTDIVDGENTYRSPYYIDHAYTLPA